MRVPWSFVVVICALAAGCSPEKPSVNATNGAVADEDGPPLPVVTKASTSLLFSFVDAAGRVVTVPTVDAVPETVRARVLVVDLEKTPEQRQAHRYAFFADLTDEAADGTFPVVVVSRYQAVGHASTAALPAPDGSVIVYSAAWCGYCKKTMAWMRQNNVPFIERDVEKVAGAGAEVAAKLKAAGVPGGGIPVIDWGGTLVVGFQQDKLAALLAATPKPPQQP